MSDADLESVLVEYAEEIVVGAKARLRGEESMAAMAAERNLTEGEMAGQVLGFWLQAIRTDVALGTTAAIEQNLTWLVRLRSGQDLHFADALVTRMFDDLSAEIDTRLASDAARTRYAGYRRDVSALILQSFPEQ